MTLAEIFPDADYQFRIRFERHPPGDFFQPTRDHAALLAERQRWLQAEPTRYGALLPEGVPLLDETLAFAASQGIPPGDLPLVAASCDPKSRCLALGMAWEPDFLLLRVEPGAAVRLVGGCVCFPSSWSLEEKLGKPIEFIHETVPGLNASIGGQIHSFLVKLRPGIAWERSNWGLSRSPDLNQHPTRRLAGLDETIRLEEVWLRIEHQALLALPASQGVLFGIRLQVQPLSEVRADNALTPRLARALRTMPEDVARYKGLNTARAKLIELLQG